jgi:hypothetical protein
MFSVFGNQTEKQVVLSNLFSVSFVVRHNRCSLKIFVAIEYPVPVNRSGKKLAALS